MIIVIPLAILFIILAIVFLLGKGDMLIAGYNTASEKERQEINIKRLRILMAMISVITAGFCSSLPIIGNNSGAFLGVFSVFVVFTIIFVILVNTWAKKK